MTEPITSTKKSPYFEGRRLPLGDLSSGDFEKFVAACLVCIEDTQSIEIQGLPTGSGDGGFDISGRDVHTGRAVCIQCKRQKRKLGIAQVAHELAKVAASSKIEGSDVGQHRFLCTGGLANDLVKLLRGDFRTTLATEAGVRLINASDDELQSLRDELIKRGEDPQVVVRSYVDRLDKLLAWDQDGLDVVLSSRWTKVLDVIEKYFTVANVVREHPRASFDRESYAKAYTNGKADLRPRFAKTRLPAGMNSLSFVDSASRSAEDRHLDDLNELSKLDEGKLVVLVGDGGVGKTTVLELIRTEVLQNQLDSSIAVLVSLANYSPNNLDKLIQDELGVDFGTWRTLPDRVLLLFDGLNECPSKYVENFLAELKIILRRSLAACVISTREAIRHRNIALSDVPVACLRVEHLTPIAIRRYAESRLPLQEVDLFESAYLELANRANAPHLWTPFSLRVALEYWTLNASLPTTLGEMLDTLIQSRCEVDASSPSHTVGSAVVLALAGSLAFVNLIENGRLDCPEVEAGRWVRNAKALCIDAIGIADMPEQSVVELLKRHDLLRLTSTGNFTFGHQILVGALATKILARNWRTYLKSTEDSVTDDAWIFAARLIPEADVPQYLEAMFKADLMLGARAARELESHHQELAEKTLLKCVESTSPEIVQIQGIFALAMLATPNAIARIKQMTDDPDRDHSYRAKQALAATGDRQLLQSLISTVEYMRAGPWKVSGGELDIWGRAPYSARLEVARERLMYCRPGSPIKESLSLIAYEQDPNDRPLVERQFHPEMDVSQWAHVIQALHQLDRDRARTIFHEELEATTNAFIRAKLFQIAWNIGIPFDIAEAFECALTESQDDEPDRAEHELNQLVQNVIVKAELSQPLTARVELELTKAIVGNRVGRLWDIAASFSNPTIANLAESRLAVWDTDLGYVCNYFLEQPMLPPAQKQRLLDICERGLARQSTWHTWHTSRALALVESIGFRPTVAAAVASMVQQINRIRLANENQSLSSLSAEDMDAIAQVDAALMDIHLGQMAAALISPVTKAKRSIPAELRFTFLYFDLSHFEGVNVVYRELLLDLDNEEVDAILSQLEKPSVRLSSLCAACTCAITELRIKLLASELSKNKEFPMALNLLSKAIDSCWCIPVCQMVMETVASFSSWTHTQFFWDFANVVANHLSPSDCERIDSALQKSRTQFSTKILRLWRDRAVRARIGIGLLPTAN